MADDTNDLELDLEDAGISFRAEMWATNFMLANWKLMLAALILGLLSILVLDITHHSSHVTILYELTEGLPAIKLSHVVYLINY